MLLASLAFVVACLPQSSQAESPAQARSVADPDSSPARDAQELIEASKSRYATLHSGALVLRTVDLTISGRGFDFVWERTYRSDNDVGGPLGDGWDFSYNVSVKASGADLVLRDGTGRADLYTPAGTDAWMATGHDRVIYRDANGDFEVSLRENSKWRLNRLDGSTAEGRLTSIKDRNGNLMAFEYDAAGQLSQVTDTLGRLIDVVWINGRIRRVEDRAVEYGTDGKGRLVRYLYNTGGLQPLGGSGRLASARLPVVVGTSNGNDFPNGKFWQYTYAPVGPGQGGIGIQTVQAQLLKVIDPDGQTVLENAYYAGQTQHSNGPLKSQWLPSGGGTTFDYAYDDVDPAQNNGATTVTIVNDRVGNVCELYYDENLLVRSIEYTGRAPDASEPTTLTTNRPAGQVRSTDPASFLTDYDYDSWLRLTEQTDPNGNVTQWIHDVGNVDPRGRGNLLMLHRAPGPLGGDQTETCKRWQYDTIHNVPTAYIDGRGHQTTYVVSGDGVPGTLFGSCSAGATAPFNPPASNPPANSPSEGGNTETVTCPEDEEGGSSLAPGGSCAPAGCFEMTYNDHGQIRTYKAAAPGGCIDVEWIYYDDEMSPMYGFLEQRIESGSLGLYSDSYDYDVLGNVVVEYDGRPTTTYPRGNPTTFERNAYGEVIRITGRQPADYETVLHYDSHGNPVKREVENVLSSWDDATSTVEYTSSASHPWIVTDFEYDLLDNLVRIVSDVDQTQRVTEEVDYDANELAIETRSPLAVSGEMPNHRALMIYDERDLLFNRTWAPTTVSRVTERWDYDGNRNLVLHRVGFGVSKRDRTFAYDGFDRVDLVTDPMGNVRDRDYDADGHRVREQWLGEDPDVSTSSGGNITLLDTTWLYDERGRLEEMVRDHLPADSVYRYYRDELGRLITIVDPRDNVRTFDYETTIDRLAGPVGMTDAEQNEWELEELDGNKNPVKLLEIDAHGGSQYGQRTHYEHDEVDRLHRRRDKFGNAQRFLYDSRGNLTWTRDENGVEELHTYDGLNRLVSSVRDMNGNGPRISDAPDLVKRQEWDDASRLISEIDELGNATRYAYDERDRVIAVQQGDGTFAQTGTGIVWATGQAAPDLSGFTSGFDMYSNPVLYTDANGTETSSTFDKNERLISVNVTPASSVGGSTSETFVYDGVGRIVEATNVDAQVERTYDSLGGITTEVLTIDGTPYTTSSVYDPSGNAASLTYPDGTVYERGYDALDRVEGIMRLGSSQSILLGHVGRGRYRRDFVDFPNGVDGHFTYFDDTQIDTTHPPRSTATTHFSKGATVFLDRTYQWDGVANRTRSTGPGFDRALGYDDAYRLDSVIETAPASRTVDYDIDGAHNRLTVTASPGISGSYVRDVGSPTFDREVNQYSETPTDRREYDDNGNLVAIRNLSGTLLAELTYDFRNRLVEYEDVVQQQTTTFEYDAFGRRTKKDGPLGARTYLYGGEAAWQVFEERDAQGDAVAAYVYGEWIDELLQVRSDVDGQAGFEELSVVRDDQYDVVGITNHAGSALLEAYAYDEFGARTPPVSAYDMPYGFQGRRLDPETGLYLFRNRYYDATTGRFITRDPIGTWGDPANRGNAHEALGGNPGSRLDPHGLSQEPQSGGDKHPPFKIKFQFQFAVTIERLPNKGGGQYGGPNPNEIPPYSGNPGTPSVPGQGAPMGPPLPPDFGDGEGGAPYGPELPPGYGEEGEGDVPYGPELPPGLGDGGEGAGQQEDGGSPDCDELPYTPPPMLFVWPSPI